MTTLRCTVEYDGSAFAGFQRQPGLQTVQGALETAIARVAQQPVAVVGAGRTDAGVHALGQVVHFAVDLGLPIETLQRAMNAVLAPGVAVRDLAEVPGDFHARYSARSREYRYVVENTPVRSPLWRGRAYHVAHPLAVERMDAAARHLEGRHDFAAFGSPMEHTIVEEGGEERTARGSTVRTVFAARCWGRRRFVLFRFIADAFLRHMVRMLVGTLLRIGGGKLPISAIRTLLTPGAALSAGPAAPAHGLYLVRVAY